MELKEGDAEKINTILLYLSDNGLISDRHIPESLSLSYAEYIRLKTAILHYDAARLPDTTTCEVLGVNKNTRNYYETGYFKTLHEKQSKEAERQDEVDKDRKIGIRNKQWALPLSIVSIVISVLALLVAFCK